MVSRSRKAAFLALGMLMLGLGVIGAFLPVMPTTIFIILAAWCFGRSSPRLETWLLHHPVFGPSLRQWREQGSIPTPIKIIAVTGMVAGYAIFWITCSPAPWLALAVGAAMVAAGIYVVTRPAPVGIT
ncbi:MAG TPA: YbaN family protein [Xanthobacteraceae bacterium]|nr:YbaN family protein [Xanthobacteraceae bacterium]